MSKLRLDYFLSLGLKLVKGDEYDYSNMHIKLAPVGVKSSNKPCENDENRFITSFALRKNTGVQPCGDDVPVVVERVDEGHWSNAAKACDWNTGIGVDDINSWKPDIDALIKMQDEFDSNAYKAKCDDVLIDRAVKQQVATDSQEIAKAMSDSVEQKPRVKVEYVKRDFTKLSDAFIAHEYAALYYNVNESYLMANNAGVVSHYELDNLYRKVETEISWQDEFKLFLSLILCDEEVREIISSVDGWDKEFLEMCNHVAH